jgi:hypothetical protein
MKPTLRPAVDPGFGIDQITLDLFTSEGAPCKGDPLPHCVPEPGEIPKLDPRRMPQLRLACPGDQDGAAQRYRLPLWRAFEGMASH